MERAAWPKNVSSSRKHEIQDLLHGQNPAKKLARIFDAHSQTGNNTRQPLFAEHLVINILGSFNNTLSLSSSAESDEVLQVPSNARARSEVSEGSESVNTPLPRMTLDGWKRLDQDLIDGQLRRIYDQKLIRNSKLPRHPREIPITEAVLKLRMEIRRIYELPEMQLPLHNARVKFLQAIQEKSQKGLSLDGSDPTNLEGARAQRADFSLAISSSVDAAHEGGGGGGERNNSNVSNMMMGMKEETYERGGHQNHGSALQIYEGEADPLSRISSSNPPQLMLHSPFPRDDSIPLSFNTSRIAEQGDCINAPVFFDFLSVNHEQ